MDRTSWKKRFLTLPWKTRLIQRGPVARRFYRRSLLPSRPSGISDPFGIFARPVFAETISQGFSPNVNVLQTQQPIFAARSDARIFVFVSARYVISTPLRRCAARKIKLDRRRSRARRRYVLLFLRFYSASMIRRF